MKILFEEIDFQKTPIGDLCLRRRKMQNLSDQDIYEVKLGDEYLMTSLFHESEIQLAKLALKKTNKPSLDVVVGGLGLGYTAAAALEDARIKSLSVIEYLEPVIHWHKNKLVPLGESLSNDPRCEFLQADFFCNGSRYGKGI